MRKIFTIVALMMAIVMLPLFINADKSEELESLKMVMIPAAESAEEKSRYVPIIEYISEKIGMPIELVVATDYSAAIMSLKVNDSQMARLSPFSYVLATTQTEIEPIVRGIKRKTGKDVYYGYIISRTDSGLKTLEALQGKTFAFVDPGSTSGHLLPNAVFAKAGIDPETFFSKVVFAGSHPAVILAVLNGHVDAGAIADNRWEDAMRAGVIREGELYIIMKTGMVPTSPIVVRKDLPEELKQKLIEAWMSLPPELSSKAVGKLSGYALAKDEDYDFLREIAKVLDLDLTK